MSAKRDPRIDALRGLAIYVILVDHIAGNPLARFTLHRFGYSAASEAFVFLSGLSCALAFAALLERQGLGRLMATLSQRTLRLYAVYVAASVAVIALVYTAAGALEAAGALHPSWQAFARDPLAAMRDAALLVTQPELPGILVLYMALTFLVVPLFLRAARRNLVAALAASFALWALTQTGAFGLDQKTLFNSFNPVAWQFLFCIGMGCGLSMRAGTNVLATRHAGWIVAGAWTVLAICLTLRAMPWLGAGAYALDNYHKYNLAPLRLVHFLALAVVVAWHIDALSRLLQLGRGILVKTGRRSLETFAFGSLASEAGTILFTAWPLSFAAMLAVNAVAIAATAALALALDAQARNVGVRQPRVSSDRSVAPADSAPRGLSV